jgi:hypothetical protein
VGDRSTPEHAPGLDEVSALAESLDSKDQMRLIARLLESLPPKHRAAIVEFGLQRTRTLGDKLGTRVVATRVDPIGPTLWERLFDPSKTSELYSAPRRFDLATIFVVTAAYSILFGMMSALDFGPAAKISVGLLITVVAASQAFFHDKANPRGISIVTGAITLSVILVMLRIFVRNSVFGPLFIVVVFFGIIGGAFSGYLSGVLVGGVFLVADALRARFEGRSKTELSDPSADDVD